MHMNATIHLETDFAGRNALHYFCASDTASSLKFGDGACRAELATCTDATVRCMHPDTAPLSMKNLALQVQAAQEQVASHAAAATGQAGAQPSSLRLPLVALWLGQEPQDSTAQGQRGGTGGSTASKRQPTMHGYMLRMRSLVLLEDMMGRAPIDSLCAVCGNRYRSMVGMHSSNGGAGDLPRQLSDVAGEDAGRAGRLPGATAACIGAIESIGGSGGHPGTLGGGPQTLDACTDAPDSSTLQCSCGGIVWRCAVEQSLRVCALIAPDALRASTRPGEVLGVPKCVRSGSDGAPMLADLPKEVRVLICQRSCIATGLMQPMATASSAK